MNNAYDFNEMVELFDLRKAFASQDLLDTHRSTMPLHAAICIVVEEWSGDKFRQLAAIIRTQSGKSIRSLEEIERLYGIYRSQTPTSPEIFGIAARFSLFAVACLF